MINFEEKTAYTVEDLRRIVHLLRAPGGCPWDGAQTHESIRRNFLEEAYEVAEAIDEKNPAHLKEELGDVLLQVLFHASIEEDAGRFTLDDVADGICKKLIFRHPHVFGGAAATPDSWEELKRQEKGQTTYTATLQSVAKSLPGLWRAEKIQAKAEKAGFEWPNVQAAMDKLTEELEELQTAVADHSNVEEAACTSVGSASGARHAGAASPSQSHAVCRSEDCPVLSNRCRGRPGRDLREIHSPVCRGGGGGHSPGQGHEGVGCVPADGAVEPGETPGKRREKG